MPPRNTIVFLELAENRGFQIRENAGLNIEMLFLDLHFHSAI